MTYGVCSSTAADWVVPNPNNGCGAAERIGTAPIGAPDMKPASPPPVAELIAKWHPDAVMVILGIPWPPMGRARSRKTGWTSRSSP
ncbi:hypothetical protein RAA17_09285 [Komagataeibacter rhaeticus]|nr:hypothetical protein [Komagataeibacter rhaeticus]